MKRSAALLLAFGAALGSSPGARAALEDSRAFGQARSVEAVSLDAAGAGSAEGARGLSRASFDGDPAEAPEAESGGGKRMYGLTAADPGAARKMPKLKAPPPPGEAAEAKHKLPGWALYGGAGLLGAVQGGLAGGLLGALGGAALGIGAAYLFSKKDYGGAFGLALGGIVGSFLGGPIGGLVGGVVGGLIGHFLGKLFR